MINRFQWYRRMRGGRWATVTGLFVKRKWIRVNPECIEVVDEDWTDPVPRNKNVYGHDRTIHRTGHVDVEVDRHGGVVSVWFGCALLPFRAVTVHQNRSQEMITAYSVSSPGRLIAVEFEDEPEMREP